MYFVLKVTYEYLIVALGITADYEKIPGLHEGMESLANVCSNYHPKYVLKTFPAIRNAKKGLALFTHPNTPLKCAGASQKIMYLAEEHFRHDGKRKQLDVAFATPGPAIFGVHKYAEELAKIVAERNIQTFFKHNLVKLEPAQNRAVFEYSNESVSPIQNKI